jgi:hypothetical protein
MGRRENQASHRSEPLGRRSRYPRHYSPRTASTRFGASDRNISRFLQSGPSCEFRCEGNCSPRRSCHLPDLHGLIIANCLRLVWVDRREVQSHFRPDQAGALPHESRNGKARGPPRAPRLPQQPTTGLPPDLTRPLRAPTPHTRPTPPHRSPQSPAPRRDELPPRHHSRRERPRQSS